MEGTGDITDAAPPSINGASSNPGRGGANDRPIAVDSGQDAHETYDSLLDEYGVLNNAFGDQFYTTDIVSPIETEEEKAAFLERNEQVSDLVALLSTTAGCKEWIRREMRRREADFISSETLRILRPRGTSMARSPSWS